jgi:methyl-accepting chemotaxis protein
VGAAQTSLASAQESAEIIDRILRVVARIPFVNLDYNPPVPLHTALAEVSSSMDDLPGSFATMENSLENASSNLEVIQADIALMSTNVREIKTSLESARDVVKEYQAVVTELQSRTQGLETRLPTLIDLSAIVLTLFLAWMSVTQIGLFYQGWELLGSRQR